MTVVRQADRELSLPGKGVVVRWPRPEGGDERGELMFRYHRCKEAPKMAELRGDPDIDLLCFPVGLAGWEMPSGVAFEVPAASACGACGRYFRIWCVWTSPKIHILG